MSDYSVSALLRTVQGFLGLDNGQFIRPKQNDIIEKVPPEILIQIFSLLPSYKDNDNPIAGYPYFGIPPRSRVLSNISRVCRSWCTAASTLIFQQLFVPSYLSLCKLHHVLTHSPRLAPSVRTCTIRPVTLSVYDPIATFLPNKYLEVLWRVLEILSPTTLLDLWFYVGPESPGSLIILDDISFRKQLISLDLHFGPIHSEQASLTHLHFPRLQSLTIRCALIDDDFGWPSVPHVRCLRLIDVRFFASKYHHPAFMRNLVRLELIHTWITKRCFARTLSGCASTLTGLVAINTNFSAQAIVVRLYTTNSLPSLRHLVLGQRRWPFIDVSRVLVMYELAVENLTLVEVEEGWAKPPRFDHEQLSTLIVLRRWITNAFFLPNLKSLQLGISNPDLAAKALADVPKQRNIRIAVCKMASAEARKGYIPFIMDSMTGLHNS